MTFSVMVECTNDCLINCRKPLKYIPAIRRYRFRIDRSKNLRLTSIVFVETWALLLQGCHILKKSWNELKILKNTRSVLKNFKKSGNLNNICRWMADSNKSWFFNFSPVAHVLPKSQENLRKCQEIVRKKSGNLTCNLSAF